MSGMRKILIISVVMATAGLAGVVVQTLAEAVLGYTDTPMLPSGKWHVHDLNRPRPPVVTPGASFSQGAAAASDAMVLFDGTDLSKWEGEKGAAKWTVREDYMEANKTGYIHTKEKFGDMQLHVEFAEPEKVEGDSQERGNSGVFLQYAYEVQVLDSYDNPTYADGQCGALYGQSPPMANACRKPGEWQSYDIIFEAARWNENHELARPAIVTVFQNGVLIHYKQPLLGPTGHRTLGHYGKELPATGPIALQDHGNPVRFRNIWVRKITEEERP
jgi:hypothetical protein